MLNKANTDFFIAIPAMGELEQLPFTLKSIQNQSVLPAKVFICVNQPDNWWILKGDKQDICLDNKRTINFLKKYPGLNICILDRSTPGKGWTGKKGGAGWARKVAMDDISIEAHDSDILVSMDADTAYPPDYLYSVGQAFSQNENASALSAPYYHPLSGEDTFDRALLRYEVFMRYYFLNLAKINSFYAFTALGSSISLPLKSYRAIRGITPVRAGEDFYFLQKLRKYGKVLNYSSSVVYPSPRISSRAGFGTGPAIMKGLKGDWHSYPFYPEFLFNKIAQTQNLYPELFLQSMATPMDDFLFKQFGTTDIWSPLRKNSRTEKQFIRACHQKVDGLRILQFLKSSYSALNGQQDDEKHLISFLKKSVPKTQLKNFYVDLDTFSFNTSPVSQIGEVRNLLFNFEMQVRKQLDESDKEF